MRKLFSVLLTLLFYPCILNAQKKLSSTPSIYDKLEQGITAADGKRIGKWNFYTRQQELELTFDYDSSRVNFIKQDTTRYLVRVGEQWELKKVNRPPHVLGSMDKRMLELTRLYSLPLQRLGPRASRNVSTELHHTIQWSYHRF